MPEVDRCVSHPAGQAIDVPVAEPLLRTISDGAILLVGTRLADGERLTARCAISEFELSSLTECWIRNLRGQSLRGLWSAQRCHFARAAEGVEILQA